MRISIWNLKGGTGKTHLSLALAKDLNLKCYTNENNFLPEITLIQNNPDIVENAIFDFGGFVDKISDYLFISDWIIIPTTDDKFSIIKSYETYNLASKFNENIIFINTRIISGKRNPEIKTLEKKAKIFDLNESNIFKKSIETNKGILTLSEEFCFKNKKITDQYKQLISFFRIINEKNI